MSSAEEEEAVSSGEEASGEGSGDFSKSKAKGAADILLGESGEGGFIKQKKGLFSFVIFQSAGVSIQGNPNLKNHHHRRSILLDANPNI